MFTLRVMKCERRNPVLYPLFGFLFFIQSLQNDDDGNEKFLRLTLNDVALLTLLMT